MNAPAYQGIKDFILARIHAGEWSEGDQVPSENELAREFNVARMTVNRALRELTSEQVLTRVQGSGTFVARPKYESTLVAIRSISDEIVARGHRYQAKVLHIGASIGRAMASGPGPWDVDALAAAADARMYAAKLASRTALNKL